jgi:hypothetical protein
MRARAVLSVAAAALAVPAGAAVEAKQPAPKVTQMIVFRDGSAYVKRVSTKSVHVKVHGKRCAVAARTALAGLVRSKPGTLRLRDFGSCSERPADGAGLFVRRIRADRNKGQDGWVYKVGRKAATAGAADPSGPFGTGRRLRGGQRVLWFYCHLTGTSCQRSLALRTKVEAGALTVGVTGYDDEGKGKAIAGATVKAGGMSALTGADGRARLTLAAGSYRVRADKQGLVRSFSERVSVP